MPSTVSLAAPAFLLALPLCGFASTTARPVPGRLRKHRGHRRRRRRPTRQRRHRVCLLRTPQARLRHRVSETCFVDCGKHADTDAKGQFTITGLNPALKFRLLVVKDGFIATAKGGVDSALPDLPPIKISPRAPSTDKSKIVHRPRDQCERKPYRRRCSRASQRSSRQHDFRWLGLGRHTRCH